MQRCISVCVCMCNINYKKKDSSDGNHANLKVIVRGITLIAIVPAITFGGLHLIPLKPVSEFSWENLGPWIQSACLAFLITPFWMYDIRVIMQINAKPHWFPPLGYAAILIGAIAIILAVFQIYPVPFQAFVNIFCHIFFLCHSTVWEHFSIFLRFCFVLRFV